MTGRRRQTGNCGERQHLLCAYKFSNAEDSIFLILLYFKECQYHITDQRISLIFYNNRVEITRKNLKQDFGALNKTFLTIWKTCRLESISEMDHVILIKLLGNSLQ
ncbi:hypothetical protein QQG55_41520 [Brugia pahangi]